MALGAIRLLFPPSIPRTPQGATSLRPWGARAFSVCVQLGLSPALERGAGGGVAKGFGHRRGFYPRLGTSRCVPLSDPGQGGSE